MDNIKVFLDTNILVQLLDQNGFNLPAKVDYYTFEKNVYEYKNGLKRFLVNPDFIISSLKSKEMSSEQDDKMKNVARRIIRYAFDNIQVSDLDALVRALKRYNLNYTFGISGEWVYETDEHFYSVGEKYCCDFDRCDPMVLLHLFYKHIHCSMTQCFYKIDKIVSGNNINVLIYQQVFGIGADHLQEQMHNAFIPSEDLEIVLAAIETHCDLFLSCDKELVKSCLSLGSNQVTNFRLCNPQTLLDDISKAIKDYCVLRGFDCFL